METQASREPGAMVIHFQDTSLTGRAVMRTVGFRGMALFAEPRSSSRRHGNVLCAPQVVSWLACWKYRICPLLLTLGGF